MRLSVALLATSVAAFTPQPKRSATNMALRVERSVGEGLLAAAPEPVAEPAKRGLAALFGR